MDYNEMVREARERAADCETLEERLWCIALAIGPDQPDRGMWEAGDGTPIDVVAHLTALAEGLRRVERVTQALEKIAAHGYMSAEYSDLPAVVEVMDWMVDTAREALGYDENGDPP